MDKEFEVLGPVSDRFDALVIPKFTSEEFRRVEMLAQVHFEKKSFFLPAIGLTWIRKKFATYGLIESPWSLVNLDNMLKVLRLQLIRPHCLHLQGLIFGAEDYAHSAGITRTPSLLEMAYARQKVVTVAKAWNLQSFDLVSSSQVDVLIRFLPISEIWILFGQNVSKARRLDSRENKRSIRTKYRWFTRRFRRRKRVYNMQRDCYNSTLKKLLEKSEGHGNLKGKWLINRSFERRKRLWNWEWRIISRNQKPNQC